MAGICQACGKKAEKLRACLVCGAQVCTECITEKGCRLCGGRTQA